MKNNVNSQNELSRQWMQLALIELLKTKNIEVLITLGAGDVDNYVTPIYELLKDR